MGAPVRPHRPHMPKSASVFYSGHLSDTALFTSNQVIIHFLRNSTEVDLTCVTLDNDI